jgi:hypothetical protein
MKIGATHAITGRQWGLDPDPTAPRLWPDATIVIPFSRRAADATGKVANPVLGVEAQGGYAISHRIDRLELRDLVHDADVPGVRAVWAAGPGGDNAQLHILGTDPFAWLTPHLDTPASAYETAAPIEEVSFGAGPVEALTSPRIFGDLTVRPTAAAELLPWLSPPLPGRLMVTDGVVLEFRRGGSASFAVHRVWLGILTDERTPKVGKGHEVVEWFWNAVGHLHLAIVEVDVGGSAESIMVEDPAALVFVRWQVAPLTVEVPQKIVLVPGHYRLTLTGRSTGRAPTGFADAAPVDWSLTREFWVDPPESLRPYVAEASVGDARMFGLRRDWDPTLYGVGFPAYRTFRPVVRFCVPYLAGIFDHIRVRVRIPGAADTVQDLVPAADPEGRSTLPQVSQDWMIAQGGAVAADNEVAVDRDLPVAGAGALELAHQAPGRPETLLDSWAVHVSRFATFAEHVAWAGACVTVAWGPAGRSERAPCPAVAAQRLIPDVDVGTGRELRSGEGTSTHLVEEIAEASRAIAGRLGKWLHPIDPDYARPTEPSETPADWRLPARLVAHCGALRSETALHYLEFFRDSETRLAAAPDHPLSDLGRPAAAATVEAIVDSGGQVLALWLRTPEPLDVARVSAAARVRHVEPAFGCPDRYTHRAPLDLTLHLLPSPDATSTLLVGSFAGVHAMLPRGEYALTLHFDPAATGLPRLRPAAGGTDATVGFLQPFGADWPVVHDHAVVPWDTVNQLLHDLAVRAVKPKPQPWPGPEPWWDVKSRRTDPV